jgi:outer-membrane receptor for ferric coprogen and ferric-rhodotorulic acid
MLAYPWGAVDPTTNLVQLYVSGGPQDQRQNSYDVNLGGPFKLFGREHKVVVGANYNVSTYATANYSSDFSEQVSLTDPTYYFATPSFTADGSGSSIRSEQYGVYGNVRFSLADPLTLVIGGRTTWWNSTDTEYTTSSSTTTGTSISAKFTKQVGLIYELNKSHSIYASYNDVFQPQSYSDQSGNVLKPITGKQEEVGIKGDYLNGALTASLALFHLNETNRAQAVTDSTGDTLYYVSSGATSTRGVELSVNGRIRSNWDIYGGYTYTLSHDLQNPSDTSLSAMSAIAPRHMLRVGTDYRLTGDWNRFNVGGNFNVQSKMSSIDSSNNNAVLTQGGYSTIDLHAGYKVSKNVNLALNITNLFDRYYYQRINTAKSGNVLGDPRAVSLTLRMTM